MTGSISPEDGIRRVRIPDAGLPELEASSPEARDARKPDPAIAAVPVPIKRSAVRRFMGRTALSVR
jgi:hypothetical protein